MALPAGVAFALGEALGCAPRHALAPQIAALDQEGRKALARVGVRLGALSVFMPAMLKPARSRCAGLLWWACNGAGTRPPVPGSAVSMDRDPAVPDGCYAALGLILAGQPGDPSGYRGAHCRPPAPGRPRRAVRRRPRIAQAGLVQAGQVRGRARRSRLLDGRHRHRWPATIRADRTGPPQGRQEEGGDEGRGANPDSPFAKLSVLATGAARPS